MKHTRRLTLKRNFLAKLCRGKLNYDRGQIEWSSFKWTSKSAKRKDGLQHPEFHGFSQRFADYYGFDLSGSVNDWLTHHDGMRDRTYFDWDSREDNTKEFRRKEKHRRKLKKFIKKNGLEHKLLYK